MLSLILRHEVMFRLPKTMAIAFAVSGLVINLVVFYAGEVADEQWLSRLSLSVLQVFVYLSAGALLFLPEAGRRCRAWELSLPLPGRRFWQGHYFSLMLGGFLVMSVYAPFPVLVYLFDRAWEKSLLFKHQITSLPDLLWDLWGLPFLFWVLTLDIILTWWPGSAWPGSHRAWNRRLFWLLPLLAVALGLVGFHGLTWAALGILTVMGVVHVRLVVPEGLTLPDEARSAGRPAEYETTGTTGARTGAWIVHRTLCRVLFKWPAHWLAMPLFGLFFGIILGGFNPWGGGDAALRFGHVFMVAYMMLAGSGFLLEKLHLVDFLPISRRTILAWLMGPMILSTGLGYGLGALLLQSGDDVHETFAFVNGTENYGLKVPPRLFVLARGDEVPEIVAPWGESQRAESTPVLRGLPWVLYKPFSTPEGSSLRFVNWQLERAVADFYGQDYRASGLFQEAEGRVLVRDEGLRLAADHPGWSARPTGPLFPFLMGFVLVIYLAFQTLIFALLRRQASQKKVKIVFWSVMISILLLHIGGFAILIAGLTQDWVIEGLVFRALSVAGTTGPGFTALAYAGLLLIIILGWSAVWSRFRRLEAPR